MAVGKPFRNLAGFWKRIEYWIIGRMLKEGMDVYVPLVDDHAVDAIIRRRDGSIAMVQNKARSRDVIEDDAALFAAIEHEPRQDSGSCSILSGWSSLGFSTGILQLNSYLSLCHRNCIAVGVLREQAREMCEEGRLPRSGAREPEH
ncbi:MAG: hypothetical protein KGL31_01615, partial [candidate division NC10 bacterium]|nr:hypothetical protein [candidate division NC10 bacterium]